MTNTMPIRWKVGDLLEARGLSGYQFWKASGLGKRTAYRIVNGDVKGLNTDTLDAAIKALRQLVGEDIGLTDVIEYQDA